LLNKLKINLVVGRLLNKNKNPGAENSIKEVQKEILRIKPTFGPLTDMDLALVIKNVKSRIRHHGFSSREVLFRRNLLTNIPFDVKDDYISAKLYESRTTSKLHNKTFKSKTHKETPVQKFNAGHLVYVRQEQS